MLTIRVPASSANLGPGFDCLGMAVSLYADITFTPREEGLIITGCPAAFADPDNLIYRAFTHATRAFGKRVPGLEIAVRSDIPPARGLGSSAACTAAGVMAAGKLLKTPLSREEQLRLCTALEGHPDNAAAAVYGGIRVSVTEGGRVISLPVDPHPDLRLLALVPDFPLETARARQALPDTVPREDAVFNLSRTALVIKALETGAFHLLETACEDRLHQPYRFPLINGGEALAAAARTQGADACVISGAGPSLMCFYHDPGFPARISETLARFPAWQALPLSVATGIKEMRTT
ncbi:MAG: homoserine kinase [Christensenellales bacterium]|jgi:homoserine kinase